MNFNKKIIFFFFLLVFATRGETVENSKLTLKLKYGEVKIELFDDVAPNHVKRILELSKQGKYDGVAFHRVIDGFMAQTGDVQHGNTKNNFNPGMVGTGGSDLPDLKAEFNNIPHERGVLSMARSQNPDSANSQFFICFDTHPHLDRQYTVFGKVVSGMEFVDQIKKGAPGSGSVNDPDIIEKISIDK
jgi:cyclophilin family peptidyl-prolyl cis-trans isomerase